MYNMKNFSEYLNERQLITDILLIEHSDEQILLNEGLKGFIGKLSKMFSFNAGKLQGTMEKWEKDLKDAFIAGQMAGAKGGETFKDFLKKQDTAAEKGSKELLDETKNTVELLMKKWDDIKQVDFPFAQCKQLAALAKQEKDEKGIALAEKFKKLIDDKFPDGGKQYEQTISKIEKAGADKSQEKGNEEITTDDIKNSISSNKDILSPLVNALNGKIDGNKLVELVDGLMEKDPIYKGKSEAAKTANSIGMSAVICGAAMITSPKCLERVCEWAIDNTDKLTGLIKSKELKLNTAKK